MFKEKQSTGIQIYFFVFIVLVGILCWYSMQFFKPNYWSTGLSRNSANKTFALIITLTALLHMRTCVSCTMFTLYARMSKKEYSLWNKYILIGAKVAGWYQASGFYGVLYETTAIILRIKFAPIHALLLSFKRNGFAFSKGRLLALGNFYVPPGFPC